MNDELALENTYKGYTTLTYNPRPNSRHSIRHHLSAHTTIGITYATNIYIAGVERTPATYTYIYIYIYIYIALQPIIII